MSSSLACPRTRSERRGATARFLRCAIALPARAAGLPVYWSAGRLRGFHGSPDGAARTRRGDGVAVSWIVVATVRGIAKQRFQNPTPKAPRSARSRARALISQKAVLIGVGTHVSCNSAVPRKNHRCGCQGALLSQHAAIKFKAFGLRRAERHRYAPSDIATTPKTSSFIDAINE